MAGQFKPLDLEELQMVAFPNRYKEAGDRKPHYTGQALISGRRYKVALWVNKTKTGSKNLGGRFTMLDDVDDIGEVSTPSPENEVPF